MKTLTLQKIGFFGGSFDPPHFGHINLAIEMLEKRNLDEVWFCPARISPHKAELKPLAIEHRLQMVELALKDCPQTRLIDCEAKREGPSFTLDTLKLLIQTEKDKEFHLILGEDALQNFHLWHRPEEIAALVPILIGARTLKLNAEILNKNPLVSQAFQKGWTPTRIMQVEATEIRKRLSEGRYCGHLLPKEVLDYINKHRLYSIA